MSSKKVLIMPDPAERKVQQTENGAPDPGAGAGVSPTPDVAVTQKYLRDTAELLKNLKALGGITELEAKIDKLSVDLKELRSDLNGLGGRTTRQAGRIDTAQRLFGLFLGAAGLLLGAIGVILTIFGPPIVSYILAHYRIIPIP